MDYLSPAIYLTDILLIFLLPYLIKRLEFKKYKKNVYLFFLAVLFVFSNIIFAQIPTIALFKWLVVFKLLAFGLYFYSCDLVKLKKTIISALSLSLITLFLIGLAQFILQRTIGGPFYLLGERNFTSLTPGISLMNVFGKSMMRAYSIFPHPNSFAGFVVVSFLIILSFYSEQIKTSFRKPPLLFIVVVLSLLLTLSLNAILGVILVITLFLLSKNYAKVVKKIKVFIPILLISSSLFLGVVSSILPKDFRMKETYEQRVLLAHKALEIFSNKPIFGVGLNNFFFAAKNIQPPHNLYLLVLSECGIVGILILYFLLTKLFNRPLNKFLFLAIVFVSLTGVFDHYWFTLQQNQLILSLLLGLLTRRDFSKIVPKRI